jgi:hypothetical protein
MSCDDDPEPADFQRKVNHAKRQRALTSDHSLGLFG